ncbi:MAG: hypothetical protein GXO74_08825 [Calditrichaeota bacterium]|nr:hypothetical protein [Calditrichota bacterium]
MTFCRITRIVFFSIFTLTVSLFAAADIFPLQQIKPGMTGVGYTVFDNDRIESFEVEVLDVVQNFFPARSIIVVRLHGKKAEHVGVAAGMSGSPIYFDGRLAGALAYSFGNFMKDPIAGVTPIEQMLPIFAKEKNRAREAPHLSLEQNYRLSRSFFSAQKLTLPDLFSVLTTPFSGGRGDIRPIKTPLLVSGFAPEILQKLDAQFAESNFQIFAAGNSLKNSQPESDSLRPGDAVSVVLVGGDYDISAMGTVTFSDGKRILAFGHPLFDSGPVSLPMAKGHVVTTLSSLAASSKFGTAGKIIGAIRQDRSTGIMGVIGATPELIPLEVKFTSPVAPTKNYHFQLSGDRSHFQYLPVFLWMTLVNSIESARLANGDFALQLKGRIAIEDHDDVIFNNFYAGEGLGFYSGTGQDMPEAAFDVAMSLNAVLVNEFFIPKVEKVTLQFHAIPGARAAVIKKIYTDKIRVREGDTLSVFIILKPYHGKEFQLQKKVVLPQRLSEKELALSVGGSKFITAVDFQSGLADALPQNFAQIVQKLNKRRQNNLIYFQLNEKIPGTRLQGITFHAVPPSIWGQISNRNEKKKSSSVRGRILSEQSVVTDFAIQGGKIIELVLEK